MKESFFIWNGVDCRAMGMKLAGPVAIVRPEERIQHVEIPGRSGDLTETQGADVFNSYIQTASIMVHGGYRVREIYRWLKGAGFVTFSGEPDRKQAARVIGAITLNRVSRNIDHWAGEVQFYCQPFKEKLREETVSVTSSGATVKNDGDVIAYPKITVNAGAAGQDIVLAMGGKVLRINMTGMADTGCVVDCQGQVVTNYSGTANLTHLSSGEFPRLLPGDNTVTYVNASSLDIEKRERFL
jgi:phage-related protein